MEESFAGMMQDIVHEVSLVARNLLIIVAVAGAAIMMSRMMRGFIQRRSFFRELPVVGQTLALNAV